jgi:predicted Zn-ribbon and HTH transcriptional regulator
METIRQRMIALLYESEMSAKELSHAMKIREKEVYEHLPHITRSLTSRGRKLIIQPSRCLACGYVFQDRKRFTRPSRCPRCKRSRVQDPRFRIASSSGNDV